MGIVGSHYIAPPEPVKRPFLATIFDNWAKHRIPKTYPETGNRHLVVFELATCEKVHNYRDDEGRYIPLPANHPVPPRKKEELRLDAEHILSELLWSKNKKRPNLGTSHYQSGNSFNVTFREPTRETDEHSTSMRYYGIKTNHTGMSISVLMNDPEQARETIDQFTEKMVEKLQWGERIVSAKAHDLSDIPSLTWIEEMRVTPRLPALCHGQHGRTG